MMQSTETNVYCSGSVALPGGSVVLKLLGNKMLSQIRHNELTEELCQTEEAAGGRRGVSTLQIAVRQQSRFIHQVAQKKQKKTMMTVLYYCSWAYL